jgi:hypothetical protein
VDADAVLKREIERARGRLYTTSCVCVDLCLIRLRSHGEREDSQSCEEKDS